MARHTRGVLPLALLIAATLVGGVVLAIVRVTEEEPPVAVPTTPTPTPVETPTPTPDVTPAETPTPTPTPEETPEPPEETPEPPEETPEPPDEPREPDDDVVLAETGGPAAPFMIGGAMLIGLAGALWRTSRRSLG